jgi:hypothetical protein
VTHFKWLLARRGSVARIRRARLINVMDDRDEQNLKAVLLAIHAAERAGEPVTQQEIAASTALDTAHLDRLLAAARDLAYVVHVSKPVVEQGSPIRVPAKAGWILLEDGSRFIGVPPTDAFGDPVAE